MNADEMMPDTNLDKPREVVSPQFSNFEIRGETSKHDKQGILDENIKIRQSLVRLMTTDLRAIANDPEAASLVLKAMESTDKVIIAQARIQTGEEANTSNAALAAAIVAEALSRNERTRSERMKEDSIPHRPDYQPSGRVFELPSASREIRDEELVTGTVIVSQDEIMSTLRAKVGTTEDKEETE